MRWQNPAAAVNGFLWPEYKGGTEMKLSFCTVTYASCASWIPAYTMEETIRRLSGIGYHYLEIVTAAPHAWPYYLDGKGRAAIRESMKKYDMKASAIMPYT